MKSPSLLAALILLSAGSGTAHNYDPVLAPLATAHRAAIAKIAEKRDAVTRIARDEYLVQLEIAQKEAAQNKQKKLVERIKEETQAVKAKSFASTEGFSRQLLSARGSLENALKQAGAEAEREARPINASYLTDLNRIPVGGDSAQLLAHQIESEKKALGNGVIGLILNPETDLPGTKWSLLESPEKTWSFSYDKEVKLNNAWRVSFPEADKLVVHWSKSSKNEFKLATNGRYLLKAGKPHAVLVTQEK